MSNLVYTVVRLKGQQKGVTILDFEDIREKVKSALKDIMEERKLRYSWA